MSTDLTQAKNLIKGCQETLNRYLDLGNCGIKDLTALPELFQCTHIETLILSARWLELLNGEWLWVHSNNNGNPNTFSIVPPYLSKLRNLKKLILSGYERHKITDAISLQKLTGLQTLDISSNQISDFSFLEKLTALESLYLRDNEISDIHFLENIRGLKTLDLSSNKISNVHFLENANGLSALYLRSNRISDIGGLQKLSDLKTLNLDFNRITKIPLPIFQLGMSINSESRFDSGGASFYNNPIVAPPPEIIKRGGNSVIEWFEATKKRLNEIKIILIGDPKAGKTSILKKLSIDRFSEDEPQTDGINIEHVHFQQCETFKEQTSLHRLIAHFWDFGGQEIMNATHQFFLTNRSVYLLVLDARKDIDVAGQVRQWVKRVKSTSGKSPIIVVANQVDLNTGFGFSNESDLQTEFPEIKYFIKASCKTGDGINMIKQKLEELIPQAELFDTEIDERWIAIKEQLEEETKTKHYLDETRFTEICANHGLNEKTSRVNVISFLNDLGLLLHFEELNLAQYYVLDPYWITYGVYQIVTSSEAGRLNGIIGMDKLEYIINEEEDKKDVYKSTQFKKIIYDTNQRRFLVDILNQFKLCFYLPGNNGFIIPNLLETTEPVAITGLLKNSIDCIRFVYKYDHLPNSVLPNIMVEANSRLSEKWRTGCVLENNNCTALVSSYQNMLTITVRGEHKKKREFMAVIRHCVDVINKKLAIKPETLIPLPDINPTVYADYEVLLNREKKGKRDFIFDEDKLTEKSFEISLLLEGIAGDEEIKTIKRELEKINQGIGVIVENQEELKIKLNGYQAYLMQQFESNSLNEKIFVEANNLNIAQIGRVTFEMMEWIGTAFKEFDKEIDLKLKDIYTDLKKSNDTQLKLNLAIPLINFLGINLKYEWDVKKWALNMHSKYELEIFRLMGLL